MHETAIKRAVSRAQRMVGDLTPTHAHTDEKRSPAVGSVDGPPAADEAVVIETSDDAPASPLALDGPYRALVPYSDHDSEVFFGRTELWRRLHVRAVPGGGPVTVLGPSGSGKTSLLHAGLIPAVTRMGLRHNDTRVPATVATMTPGTTPAHRLAEILDLDTSIVGSDPVAWTDAVAARSATSTSAYLVVIDQAEELFTLCDRPSRTAFLSVVDALAADTRFAVVLALQADFYARGMADPILVRTLDRAVVVRMMTDDELVEAIERPAGVRGGAVESGLATEIVTDLATLDTDTPPLVALGVLMDHLWQTRAGTAITAAAYRASDPVSAIVGTTAERAFMRLTGPDRETARLILLAAVRFTEQGDLVRSGVGADDLDTALRAHRRTDRVLDHLVDSELVVVEDGRVRLIHDSLAQSWPRLADWIADRRRGAAVIDTLHADADAWEGDRRPDSALYGPTRFHEASAAVEEIDTIAPGADYFLSRSRERLALRTSRRRVFLGALIIVAVVALVVAITSLVRGGDASTGRSAAELDATLARIGANTVTDPSAAATLALAAYRDAPNDPRTESALLATQTSPIGRAIGTPETSVALAASGDGSRVAMAGADGAIRVVSTTPTPQTIATIGAPSSPSVANDAVALTSDGSLLARRTADGTIELLRLDGRSATGVSTIGGETAGATGAGSLSFSPVRPWLAATDPSGSVTVWDISDATRPALVATVRTGSASTLAWNPELPQLLVGSGDQRITMWDLTDTRTPRQRGPAVGTAGAIATLAFGPDGTTAAVGDRTGAVALFDVGARGMTDRGPGVGASSGAADSVSFAPSGRRLVVTSGDGTAQVWDITHPDAPRRSAPALRSRTSSLAATVFTGESTLISAGIGAPQQWSLPAGLLDGGFGGAYPPACSIERKACVTSFAAGPVQVWDATDPSTPGAIATIDVPGHFNGATMSPDGLWMMTVDSKHLAQLWDVRDIRKPVAIGAPLSLGPQLVDHMVFSPSSGLLATSTNGDRTVTVSTVSLRGLSQIAGLDIGDATIDAIAFGADSRSIALGGGNSSVHRWTLSDTAAAPVSGTLPIGSPVTAIGVSGTDILVGDRSGALTRWDPITGVQIGARAAVDTSAITSIVAVGPRTVITSADGSIHRVDSAGAVLDAGNLFGPMMNGDSRVAAITPDTVVAAGDTGREQFWTLDTAQVATRVCTQTGGTNC